MRLVKATCRRCKRTETTFCITEGDPNDPAKVADCCSRGANCCGHHCCGKIGVGDEDLPSKCCPGNYGSNDLSPCCPVSWKRGCAGGRVGAAAIWPLQHRGGVLTAAPAWAASIWPTATTAGSAAATTAPRTSRAATAIAAPARGTVAERKGIVPGCSRRRRRMRRSRLPGRSDEVRRRLRRHAADRATAAAVATPIRMDSSAAVNLCTYINGVCCSRGTCMPEGHPPLRCERSGARRERRAAAPSPSRHPVRRGGGVAQADSPTSAKGELHASRTLVRIPPTGTSSAVPGLTAAVQPVWQPARGDGD